MPDPHNAEVKMPEEQDILDELLLLLETNGSVPEVTRNQIMVRAFMELIRRTRRIERESIIVMFRRKPIPFVAVITVSFVLLHEFATYINISVITNIALKALGIPVN